MSIDAWIVLAALFGSFLAVYREWLTADLALMAGLSTVAVTGVVEPSEVLVGFASTVLVAVASIYVLVAGLWRAGVVEWLVPSEAPDRWLEIADRLGLERRSTAEKPGGAVGPVQRAVAVAAPFALVALPVAGAARFETAALLGAVAVVVSGVLSPEAARRAVDWEVVMVVGAVVGFSQVLVSTGVAEELAAGARQLEGLSASPLPVVAGLVSALVLSAVTDRRAAASVLPLVLSTGLLFSAAGGIL